MEEEMKKFISIFFLMVALFAFVCCYQESTSSPQVPVIEPSLTSDSSAEFDTQKYESISVAYRFASAQSELIKKGDEETGTPVLVGMKNNGEFEEIKLTDSDEVSLDNIKVFTAIDDDWSFLVMSTQE